MKRLFKFLILAGLLFNLVGFCKEVKFIHITDVDLSSQNASKLYKTIVEVNEYDDVDFVVFGGNNITSASMVNLKTFCHLLKKMKKKTYVLIGSSDVASSKGIDKEFYLRKVRHSLWFHPIKTNYVFKKNGYVFVVMDGAKQYFQGSNGYYTKQELRWLKETLEKYKKDRVVILQHFPILEDSSAWANTAKTEEYFELLKDYKNVKVIVSGHYGINKEVKKDGIYHIITESYSKNSAYKIIEIDLDYDFIATYLVRG